MLSVTLGLRIHLLTERRVRANGDRIGGYDSFARKGFDREPGRYAPVPRALHRIAEVREQQGLSLQSLSRRMGIEFVN